jgi:hypothetical protein
MTDPADALQALLQAGQAKTILFSPTSRYYNVEITQMKLPDGRIVGYLRRRFVPPPENFALLQLHVVTQGERLDNITARYLNDPEQFWRLCDANAALRPEELETTGRILRITLPEGIPAAPNA